jgi:molybdopterin synthase catalytic subunit
MEKLDIQILDKPLQVENCLAFVHAPAVGGQVVFIGTVRNETHGREVVRLEFESYIPMALSEMRKIGEYCLEHWDIQKVSVHHRIGSLNIGEIPVIIVVAAAHRKAAFLACAYIIDTLKETVPIWKKEIFKDGEIWVASHP